MTSTEFNEWFSYLSGRLPSMRTWMSRLEQDVRDLMIQLWMKDLEDIPKEIAIKATDAIYNQTLEEPKPWDRLTQVIRTYHFSKIDRFEIEREKYRQEKANRYVPEPGSILDRRVRTLLMPCSV